MCLGSNAKTANFRLRGARNVFLVEISRSSFFANTYTDMHGLKKCMFILTTCLKETAVRQIKQRFYQSELYQFWQSFPSDLAPISSSQASGQSKTKSSRPPSDFYIQSRTVRHVAGSTFNSRHAQRQLEILNLRGHHVDWDQIIQQAAGFDLVIIDPFYKVVSEAGADENSSSEVG